MKSPAQTCFLIFALLFPSLTAWLYFDLFAGSRWVQTVYSFGKILQFSLPVLAVWIFKKNYVAMFAFRISRLKAQRALLEGIGSGVIFAAAILALYYGLLKNNPLLAETGAALRLKLQDFGATTALRYLFLGLMISCFHSALEEYYWRGFVFSELKEKLPKQANLISSLAFSAHHFVVVRAYLPNPQGGWDRFILALAATAVVALAGSIWAFLYRRHESLAPSWISHVLADAALMWIGYSLAF